MHGKRFSEPVCSFLHISHTILPSGRSIYHLVSYMLRSGDHAEASPEITMPPPELLVLRKACSALVASCLLEQML